MWNTVVSVMAMDASIMEPFWARSTAARVILSELAVIASAASLERCRCFLNLG